MRDELVLTSMACRFPGAASTQDFWQNLITGRDLLREIPLERWDAERYYHPQPGVGGKCATKKGYFLEGVRQFDAGFFKIKPEDAEVMDPQQRILLELCYEAFVSAGYDMASLSGQKIGVFMGITKSDYMVNIAEALARQELSQNTVVTGILENLIAARIAYHFDLTGPALTLDTACSSSLVALHMAKESIWAGDCEMALVGGINLNLNVPAFLGMSAAHALSPGDHYHVFDQRSRGFFMGEGGGVVLLKKREQALADQDPILAVLAGSAVNNDGHSFSPMAPRSKTQQAVVLSACEDARVSPENITLIEAHGTGTQLGDAVEAQTLNAVFEGRTKPILSSVKPNIGHLLSAAGMGGIIKVLLCFQHRQIPPLLHQGQTRKELQLEARGFCLNADLLEIPEGQPMLAGVNGFGFGGTNAHILLRPESDHLPHSPFQQVQPAYQKSTYWVGLKEPKTAPVSPGGKPLEKPQVKVFESRWFPQSLSPNAPSQNETLPVFILADPLRSEAQTHVIEHLKQTGTPCYGVPALAELEAHLEAEPGAFQLVFLMPLSAQTLYNVLQNLSKSAHVHACQNLLVVTRGGLPIGPVDSTQGSTHPHDALLQSGLLWGAVSELAMSVQQIDLSKSESASDFTTLAHYLKSAHCFSGASQVALRQDKVWQRNHRQVSLASEPPLASRLREQGVYLVTGGASGIGALICKSMAEKCSRIQLVVVGRRAATELPELAKLQSHIQTLGSQLHYYQVDMAQASEVQVLTQHIQRTFSRLDGVVHAAGQVAPKDLKRTPYQERLGLMAPKVQGTLALRSALLDSGLCPDFFVAFSSLSAALPGYGRGLIDYVAANQFMDLYASTLTDSALPIQVIQWGPWQGSGMASHPIVLKQLAEQGIFALSPTEGIAAFHDFIDGGYEQALILKTPDNLKSLAERLPKQTDARPQSLVQPTNKPTSRSASPQKSASHDTADLEKRLQTLIQDALLESGVQQQVGPEDNLMGLGIDSMVAIELTQSLQDWGYTDLPFELFFEQQTIRDLARYLSRKSGQVPATPASASPMPVTHSLSPIQTAFYLAQTLYERPNYSYFRLSLTRHLDVGLLEKASWELLAAHPQLRAVFQQGLDESGLTLSYQVLSPQELQAALPQRSPTSLIESIAPERSLPPLEDAFVNQHFELSQAPLFRIGLQQSAEGSHVLLLFHHIVFDGVSMRNFLKGLWERYTRLENQGSHLTRAPSPRVCYEDYVQQVQAYRQSEAFHHDLQSCAAYLKHISVPQGPFLKALSERYSALESVPAQSFKRNISKGCHLALEVLALRSQTPLQMLYLSAYFKALSQWTDQSQLWVQVATAGRHWSLTGIHSLIGSFADLFPIAADVSKNQGLALAQSLRQQWNHNQPLQRVGSDHITRLAQDMGLSMPFSFSFAHFDYDWMSPEDQAQVADTHMRGYHAQTQLGLLISENNQGFYYTFNSPEGLFAESELQVLAELFENALQELGESQTSASAVLPDFWSLFESHSEQALALKTPEQELSYGALKCALVQMTHCLESLGLKEGSVLVYWGETQIDSLTLLLACLALGVVWVPVDAQSPLHRVQDICRQAKADLWVSQKPHGESGEHKILSLAEFIEQAQQCQNTDFTLPLRSQDAIAYMIFTSGSTGQPKGVPILYSALMQYLDWAIDTFDYGPHDRVILTSSLAFDASLRPILAPLMTGACLCPVDDQTQRDPLALLDWVKTAQNTVWSSVPGLWQGLIQALESEPELSQPLLPHLRLVQVGGEALNPQALKRWHTLMGSDLPVVNLYGPTETTLNTTFHWIQEPHPQGQSVPIGRALPYLSCRVFSERGAPCASGEAGELWVSGPTVTPGYLAPATQDPFVFFQGERYYRTGDRVTQDEEGIFHYLGRIDRQIKLRGYRLEPAEIENVLLGFPHLNEAWVGTLPSPSGSPQLVALIGAEQSLEISQVQAHLSKHLPGYMLPQRMHQVDAFPRLPNGKTDLAALRQILCDKPNPSAPQAAQQHEAAPEDPVANRVTAIWQKVLKRHDIAANSDFFALGGDSLSLMEAYLLLKKEGFELPKIARFHSQRRWQGWVDLLKPAPTSPVSEPALGQMSQPDPPQEFGLSPAQTGFYLWHQHLDHDDSLWKAQLALEGQLDPVHFERAFKLATQRHQLLNVQLTEGSPPVFRPRLGSDPHVVFEFIDKPSAHKSKPEPPQTLDIFKDPLLRCQLVRQGPQQFLWKVQAHHILADGLSCLVLGRDIFSAYRQLRSGAQSVGFPPLRSQFSDYTALLKKAKQSGSAKSQDALRYWQAVFAQPYQAPQLRTPQNSKGFFSLERQLKTLDLQTFKQRCQSASSTLFMGLLAAYKQALTHVTGQDDLVIGVAHHGRDEDLPDIEHIFGCFARTLPLRLQSHQTFELEIQAAQEQYQSAASHPMDPLHLMRKLTPIPRLATLLGSQFFISYIDMNPLLETVSMPDLALNPEASHTHFQPSNQDLDLFLALKAQGDSLILTLNVQKAACSQAEAEELLDHMITMLLAPSATSPVENRVQFKPFELNQTGPINAALISYLPSIDQIQAAAPNLDPTQIATFKAHLFSKEQPLWLESLNTPLGHSANLVLPFFAHEIQPGQAKRIVPAIQQARQRAQAMGARVVSLAGLLPALTSYGKALPSIESETVWWSKIPQTQQLTTGHSTTVVSMLYTLRTALNALERSLSKSHLVVVGLGSIGEATLKTLLCTQDHPNRLTLVERKGSEQRLKLLSDRLVEACQFRGELSCLLSDPQVPKEAYEADVILSAVSARQVIDINQLRPGTLVVDDSFPHCFETPQAIRRMQDKRDVLVIGGGLLQLKACERDIYLPFPSPQLQQALTRVSLPGCLPGCQLESLLLSAYPELPATLGLVEVDNLLKYLPIIEAAGIKAAPLHLEGYLVPEALIQSLVHIVKTHP